MKSLKLIVINALTLIVGIGLLSGSVSQRNAQAARFETIPAMQVNKLQNFHGQYLTVLYAVGSRPILSTDSSQINISQVKESRTVFVTSDSMQLPTVQVEKEGFRPSYNVIVYIVSAQSNYSWVNADGTVPQGATATSNHVSSSISAIDKSDVDDFVTANGPTAVMQVNVN